MYLLGNLLYDRKRYDDAIRNWEIAAEGNPSFATVQRNLGIAYFNVLQDAGRALSSFERAFAGNPEDARVLYERDQLWKRTGRSPQERLRELLHHPKLVERRDDLSLEVATLLNQVDQPGDALLLLLGRKFQPWEGGEGLVLGQYVRARLLLGRLALGRDEAPAAREHFFAALEPPRNLSEAKHLLANQSDVFYWLGESFHHSGDEENARAWWLRAAQQKGDFQRMSVREISDMTFWTGLALERLGRKEQATSLFDRIFDYAAQLESADPKIDYFATSLPTMLLFNEDLALRNRIQALFLRAQALAGLKRTREARDAIRDVLALDRSHAGAGDLMQQISQFPETGMGR